MKNDFLKNSPKLKGREFSRGKIFRSLHVSRRRGFFMVKLYNNSDGWNFFINFRRCPMSFEISHQVRDRAFELHRENLVADAHYDLLCMVYQKRIVEGRKKIIETDYLPALKKGGVNLLICSLFVDDRFLPEMGLRHALDQISCLYEELSESGDEIALCRSVPEIRDVRKDGKLAILLSLEGVEPLGNDLSLLRVFYELGVRGIGLTWSRRNFAADGCFSHSVVEGRKGGITAWGAELLREAERLGMYVDVSHLNDEGFWDLMKLSKRPFIASHSNSRELSPVMRNLTDDQIRAIASCDGVIGLNCCSNFVRINGHSTPAEMAVHALHTKELIGAEHLCFGFDFCDELHETKFLAPSGNFDSLKFYDHLQEMTEQLILHGFSDEELKGVLGENLLTFLERTIG